MSALMNVGGTEEFDIEEREAKNILQTVVLYLLLVYRYILYCAVQTVVTYLLTLVLTTDLY